MPLASVDAPGLEGAATPGSGRAEAIAPFIFSEAAVSE
jgi:hypothetical protein